MAAKFRLVTEHLYWWPVEVWMPSGTRSGGWDNHTFEVQFAAVPASEARAIADEILKLPPDEREAREHEVLIRAVRDWRRVVGADDEEIHFSEATLRQAMENGWFRQGLYRAYGRSLVHDDARRGN
ncbi:MAG: hypothetical protein DI629_03435 [Mesorhizobium amorphae]|nr:MAG: hypothetical protein DI629_03435 [Mesorhizobium amorphae]